MAILERKIIHGLATMCSHIHYPQFVLPRHKHSEYELMLFTRGSGKQFIGEGVADFKEGDVALIGSNVPHLHLCNSKLHPDGGYEPGSGEALQFLPSILPEGMADLPDYRHIYALLQRSQYGLRFYDAGLYAELRGKFAELDGLGQTGRLVCLLQVLERLYQCRQTSVLSETAYNSSNLLADANEPVNKVYAYLFNHFKENITLKEVAAYVGQHPSALCRHFKQRTDKSIFRCLAEIRVEHACKLLSYSNLSISQVAYESGYNNVSYFILQFEKVVKRKPGEYRAQTNGLHY